MQHVVKKLIAENKQIHSMDDDKYTNFEASYDPQPNLRDSEVNWIPQTHNADKAAFNKQHDQLEDHTTLRDYLLNDAPSWDNFINGHLGAYIDFQNWLHRAYFKGDMDHAQLVRIIDRAIKEQEEA